MRRLIIFLMVGLMLLSLVSCNKGEKQETESDTVVSETDALTTVEATTEIETELKEDDGMIYPKEGDVVTLANDEVFEWWSNYHMKKTDSKPYYRHEDIYYPNSVTFEWEADEKADYYRVFISTDADFAEENTERYLVNTNSLSLSHLYTGTKYYWTVIATEVASDGNQVDTTAVSTHSFTTAASPRCLEIEGVSNTRDIGGLAAVEGYRVKQGMIYRGGKLEDMTQVGKDYFTNYLGIKTDLDLRTPGEGGAGTVSPLGDDVNYVNLDGRYYVGDKGISNDLGKEIFANEIRLFADPDNYPIYIHCSLGRDRTGTLAFVIEALLGVDRNDLMMDYELSVFSVTGTMDNASVSAIRSNIQATYDYIKTFKGDSYAERTENYLLSIGITAEEIQAIRDILLEEVK